MTSVAAKVTRAGQISLPADLRRRWGVDRVLVIDHGDHAEVRPLPDDAIGQLKGRYAGLGIDTAAMRAEARAEEVEAEERRGRG